MGGWEGKRGMSGGFTRRTPRKNKKAGEKMTNTPPARGRPAATAAHGGRTATSSVIGSASAPASRRLGRNNAGDPAWFKASPMTEGAAATAGAHSESL